MKFDQQQRREIQTAVHERVGEAAGNIAPDAEVTPDAGTEGLWETWLAQGAQLQELGFSPKTLCDATNRTAEVIHEYEGAREHASA